MSAETVPTASNVTTSNKAGFIAPLGVAWCPGCTATGGLAGLFTAESPQRGSYGARLEHSGHKDRLRPDHDFRSTAHCDIGIYMRRRAYWRTQARHVRHWRINWIGGSEHHDHYHFPPGITALSWCSDQTDAKFEGISFGNVLSSGGL